MKRCNVCNQLKDSFHHVLDVLGEEYNVCHSCQSKDEERAKELTHAIKTDKSLTEEERDYYLNGCKEVDNSTCENGYSTIEQPEL